MVRYATIITDDDGREVVSAIGEFEGAAPQARLGLIEQVAPGVQIGMVRGGPVDAAGGFGFGLGSLGSSDRATATARLRKRLRLAGRSGAARSEAATPPSVTDAEACPAKPVRTASRPHKRISRSKSKVAKSTTKKSARSKSKVAKSRTTTAETTGGEHG